MAIHVDRVRFHRNGAGGETFHVVEFREAGRTGRALRSSPHLIGVVFTRRYVAVVDPADATRRFRWEDYEADLRAAVHAVRLDEGIYQ